MRIYNSLSKQLEDFKPIEPGLVKMYCCGPTVYMHPHIGNWRLFTLSDIVYRALRFSGYKVDFIMNMTDVGHLFEEDGNPEGGEDKVEKQAVEEGKSAKEIVNFYIKEFLKDYKDLNLTEPRKFTKASEYIDNQISFLSHIRFVQFHFDDGSSLNLHHLNEYRY